jgi:hypothetical protein
MSVASATASVSAPTPTVLVCNCVGKLKPDQIIFVEPVALKSVYDSCCLLSALEISKRKVNFLAILGLSWDQTQAFKTLERSEYVYR